MKLTTRQTFFILLFLSIFLMTLRPIIDTDFWWHLRTGELIVQTRFIPHTDLFSFTKSGEVWITHEWLSELLIYGIYRLGGYGLLILFFSIIITGVFLLTYFRSPTETRPFIAGFVLVLGAISTAPTWGVRPQMFSFLFTAIFLYLLEDYHKQNNFWYLIPLPFITIIWVNMHAGYLLGLTIITIYITGALANLILAELHKEDSTTKRNIINSIMVYGGCLGACLLVAIANPNGIKIIIYPFQTLISPSMQQLIQEWFSPDFHQLIWQPFALLILSLIAFSMIAKKSISPTNILLTLLFGYAALRSMRNIPFFAIIVVPVLSEQIGSLIRIPDEVPPPNRLIHLIEPLLLLCFVSVIGLRFIQVAQNQPKAEAENFPKGAVDWLASNKPIGNLFNSYDWGGYIIWRLYPEYRVFIDGRADVYGDKFIFNYLTIYHAEQGWQNKLNSQSINIVLIEPDAPLANILFQSAMWRIAYQDTKSIIFVR